MKIKEFQYPDYIDFNNSINPLLIEWSKTKEDFRVTLGNYEFLDPKYTWHSVNNLYEYEQFFPLRDFIFEKIPSPVRFESMWSVVAKKGYVGKKHRHKGTHSYCYYVDNGHNGGEEISGKMILETSNGNEVIEPQDGLLVIFSATKRHNILEYLGESYRIVIAGNLII